MSQPIAIALVGLGKISVDQHIPAIRDNPRFGLVGAVSPRSRMDGVEPFPDLATLFRESNVDAVAVNTPPQLRHRFAREALLAGKHVLLEKPPCATVAELEDLADLARAQGLTLYTGWHSQHAPAVAPARAWLEGRTIRDIRLQWRENVRQWHPGQTWIWQPGGLGVFDPGINALSILTAILPDTLRIERARLEVPGNCQTPVAASLEGGMGLGAKFQAELDFLQTGLQTWTIDIETDHGSISLAMGGAELMIDGEAQDVGPSREYPSIYERFAELVLRSESEVDSAPLALVADSFLVGERVAVTDFIE